MRKFQILYDKSSREFKDRDKKERAWEDVEKEVSFRSGKLFIGFLSLINLFFHTGSTFEQAGQLTGQLF